MTTQTSLFGGRIDVPIIQAKDPVDPVLFRDLANNVLAHQDMQSQPLISWQGEKTFATTAGGKHSGRPGTLITVGPLRLSLRADGSLPKLRIRLAGKRILFGTGSAAVSFSILASTELGAGDAFLGGEICSATGVTSATSGWLTLSGSNPYSFSIPPSSKSFSTLVDTGGSSSQVVTDLVHFTVMGDPAGDTESYPVITALHISEVF